MAGNLGASPLQQAADQLEATLRRHDADALVQDALAQTALRLAELVQALKAVPGLLEDTSAADPNTLSDADKQAARDVVERIKALLRQDDAQASELWEANARVLKALYTDAAQIEAAISGFDFEDALAMLEAAPSQIAT